MTAIKPVTAGPKVSPPSRDGSAPHLAAAGSAGSASATVRDLAAPRVVKLAPPARAAQSTVQSSESTTAGTAGASVVSRYIELEIEARGCADLDALRFSIVNSTRQIADFDQAFLAEPNDRGGWSISRASSVVKIDRQAHLVKALDGWLKAPAHAPLLARGEPRLLNLAAEADQWGVRTKAISKPWAMWLPLKARDGRTLAGLLALKSESWRPQHSAMLIPLAGAYGHAWEALAPKSPVAMARLGGFLSRSKVMVAASVAALVAAFVPVPMSALAPAEIIAAEPRIVTAPIDGVIADILAPPGAWVEQGTPIVRFVDVKLRNDLEVARRNKAVAEARHFKVVQSSTATQKDMQDLATTKAEFDVAAVELAYAAELLQRAEIKAERAGLLIYSAKSDWVGKPVSVGERLMEIGDPAKPEIKIELPVSDAIAIAHGGSVALFLDGDPLRAISGVITRASHRPTLTAEQQLAYRVHARFADGDARRIGLRGVARVSGESVPLWFYLFRRPIAAVRQRVGL